MIVKGYCLTKNCQYFIDVSVEYHISLSNASEAEAVYKKGVL